jgi:hypothetical protein
MKTDVSINADLVEKMLGRKVSWDKTSWTKAERSIPLSKVAEEQLFDVEAALDEVQSKSHAEIEQETAYKWGARALACYKLHRDEAEVKDGEDPWLLKASDFANEAMEHAAMVMDDGETLHIVEHALDQAKDFV